MRSRGSTGRRDPITGALSEGSTGRRDPITGALSDSSWTDSMMGSAPNTDTGPSGLPNPRIDTFSESSTDLHSQSFEQAKMGTMIEVTLAGFMPIAFAPLGFFGIDAGPILDFMAPMIGHISNLILAFQDSMVYRQAFDDFLNFNTEIPEDVTKENYTTVEKDLPNIVQNMLATSPVLSPVFEFAQLKTRQKLANEGTLGNENISRNIGQQIKELVQQYPDLKLYDKLPEYYESQAPYRDSSLGYRDYYFSNRMIKDFIGSLSEDRIKSLINRSLDYYKSLANGAVPEANLGVNLPHLKQEVLDNIKQRIDAFEDLENSGRLKDGEELTKEFEDLLDSVVTKGDSGMSFGALVMSHAPLDSVKNYTTDIYRKNLDYMMKDKFLRGVLTANMFEGVTCDFNCCVPVLLSKASDDPDKVPDFGEGCYDPSLNVVHCAGMDNNTMIHELFHHITNFTSPLLTSRVFKIMDGIDNSVFDFLSQNTNYGDFFNRLKSFSRGYKSSDPDKNIAVQDLGVPLDEDLTNLLNNFLNGGIAEIDVDLAILGADGAYAGKKNHKSDNKLKNINNSALRMFTLFRNINYSQALAQKILELKSNDPTYDRYKNLDRPLLLGEASKILKRAFPQFYEIFYSKNVDEVVKKFSDITEVQMSYSREQRGKEFSSRLIEALYDPKGNKFNLDPNTSELIKKFFKDLLSQFKKDKISGYGGVSAGSMIGSLPETTSHLNLNNNALNGGNYERGVHFANLPNNKSAVNYNIKDKIVNNPAIRAFNFTHENPYNNIGTAR